MCFMKIKGNAGPKMFEFCSTAVNPRTWFCGPGTRKVARLHDLRLSNRLRFEGLGQDGGKERKDLVKVRVDRVSVPSCSVKPDLTSSA